MVTLRFTNNTVQFRDTSIGRPVEWLWDFGDFSEPSTERNPEHTFPTVAQETTYTVTLTTTDVNSVVSRVSKNITIAAGPTPEEGCLYVEPVDMAPAAAAVLYDLINVAGFTAFDQAQTDFFQVSENGRAVTVCTNFGPGDTAGYKLTRSGAPVTFSVENLDNGIIFGRPSPWAISRDGGVIVGEVAPFD